MLKQLRTEWQQLKHYPPGQRFRRRYQARRLRPRRSRSVTGWILLVASIATLLVIGVVLIFLPGPAILFFLLAGALLAGECRSIAWLLDWAELASRAALRRLWQIWRRSSLLQRLVVALLLGAALLGAALLAYRVLG